MKTGMLSRAAASQSGSSSGSSMASREPSAFFDGEADALADLLNALGAGLDVGFELLRCRSSEARVHDATERRRS